MRDIKRVTDKTKLERKGNIHFLSLKTLNPECLIQTTFRYTFFIPYSMNDKPDSDKTNQSLNLFVQIKTRVDITYKKNTNPIEIQLESFVSEAPLKS